jgi:hypothetical protein
MKSHFAEVLTREIARLAGVTNTQMLAGWRRQVVEELMTPRSPYVLALQHTGDGPDRADFLDQWRELIAETVDRLLRSGATGRPPGTSAPAPRPDFDAQEIAMFILAALHGGSALSQLAQDSRPLDAALDLALGPFAAPEDNSPATTGNALPT